MRLLSWIKGWNHRAGRSVRRPQPRHPWPRLLCEPLEDRLAPAAVSLSALVGNGESTHVGAAFGTALEAQVTDANGNPVSDASVTFNESDGGTGAGATFAGSTTVLTNTQGLAIAPV